MLFLYRIAILLYGFLIRIFSLSNEKAKKFREGRRYWQALLEDDLSENKDPIIWIHAASLGEFEQGRPIMDRLKNDRPDLKILLTFFSPSGYEIRRDYENADWVYYLPLDTPENAHEFVETVQPSIAIFIKYEFWYYFLKELHDREIPVLMVSSIFRKNQMFFHWSGSFFHPVFKKINHFFVQDEQSQTLISSLSQQVTVAGDTRFDRVLEIAGQAKKIDIVEEFLSGEKCFVVGSSWPSDMKVLQPFVEKFQSTIKFIIAPHNIREREVDELMGSLAKSTRYSDPENLDSSEVLIIDNVGMLSSIYSYGSFAYIGGGLRGALHNTLEAAVYGIPIFFGSHDNNKKFREAIELQEHGAAFAIKDQKELMSTFKSLRESEQLYGEAATAAHNYVRSKSGATDLVIKKVMELT